jgi:hypothetical protein
MDRRFALLLIGALALPAVAFASGVRADESTVPAVDAQDGKDVAKKKSKNPDRMICKNEQVIGSRQTKRVCTTADQARAHRDAGREYAQNGVNKLQEVKGGN